MDLLRALQSHALFSDLDEAALRSLEADVRLVELEGQQLLFEQGDAADGLYCVLQGRLRGFRDGVATDEIGPGGCVGERALLADAPHGATVRSARDCTLLHLSPAGFQRLLHQPSIGMKLARDLARGTASPPVPPYPRTVAVMPVGLAAACDGFVDDLVEGFARHGSAVALRAAASPADDLAGYFAKVEQEHDVVVYVCAPDEPDWTRCCLRHADVALVVAPTNETPRAAPESFDVPVDLVLLRDGDGPPQGTASWLALGRYRQHHHAVKGRKGDAVRIARLLAGRATGLALSGGSSRATAYAGVFKALDASGIPIDVLAGASGGAMLGAMYAQGWDADTMLDRISLLDRAPFYRDLGPPLVSLLGGRTFNRVLQGYFGSTRLEDLPIRLMPVCTSLLHGRLVVPAEGPLWQVVRASCAAPGLFSPVPWQGDLLVDGGLLDNLPADLLVSSCARGRLLAADVHLPTRFGQPPEDLHEVGGWRLLWRRWTTASKAPSLLDILQQSAGLASSAHREQALRHVHLHIQPLAGDAAAARDQTLQHMQLHMQPLARDVAGAKQGLAAMVEAGYRETMIALEGLSG